jgi:hypothetical protein
MRRLTSREIALIRKLLDAGYAKGLTHVSEWKRAKVQPMNNDDTILRFCISSATAPLSIAAEPYNSVPVEASALDADGCIIHVLLHVRGGKLYELEYLREQPGPVQHWPRAEDLFDFLVQN